ncbi:MAG: 50S ribosomal protein L11 methyltransferase [Muribaculaceae bacterium]
MQDYIALRIDAVPCLEDITDLLAAFLCDEGFESFKPDDCGLTAYVRTDLYDEGAVKKILEEFPIDTDFTFSSGTVKGEDWNEEWEKHYFQPIVVDDKCVVHSSFHKDVPSAEYDIVIDPKMAFGTGHHSTTSNMMRHILSSDMEGKSVIDMGTGTGILAILCKMKGADNVTGIEIDPFAWENAVENAALNNVKVNMLCGDAGLLAGLDQADYFLANINRNVITSDIESYASCLKQGGIMLLSGFYRSDIPIVEKAANEYGLFLESEKEDNDWVALRFKKVR